MKNLINRASLGAKKTNYIFKARWLQGAASANESKKMQVNPRITPFRFACALLLFLTFSIGNAWGADSGLTAGYGQFILDFYDSGKLSSTSGTGLTNNNYSSFVKVYSGLTKTNVVTGASVTGTVRYGMNGGLTAGTGTAASANTHYVSFSIGSNFPVRKATVYATAYENGRWKLNSNTASSGSLGSKGATFASVTSPLIWNFTTYATSLEFKKDNGSGGNQKRLTIYTIVCEYGYRAYLTAPGTGSITAAPKTANENGAGWNSTLGAVVGLKASQQVTLTATPPSGYEVDAWTIKNKSDNSDVTSTLLGAGNSGNNPVTLTMASTPYDVTVSVTWKLSGGCSTDPVVRASSNGSVNVNGATITCNNGSGQAVAKGTCDISEYGFFYKSGSSGVTSSDTKVKVSDDGDAPFDDDIATFSKAMTNLTQGTHYYFKAYAKVGADYFLGSETNFTTKTITATSDDEDICLVDIDGNVITAVLADGYQYADPAYTVTGGSAGSTTTVEQDGDDFTVTSNSTSNITVNINYEAIPTDYFIDALHSTTGYTGVGKAKQGDYSADIPSLADKSKPGESDTECDKLHYHFAGWVAAAYKNDPEGHIATLTGTADNTTYYAVWEQEASTASYEKVTSTSAVVDGVYVIISNSRYLPNTQTGSGTPPASGDTYAVTLSKDGSTITSTVSDEMKWYFTMSAGKATIRNASSSGDYLYEVNDGNGIRIYTTSDTWTIETNSTGFAMKGTNNSRYCGIYTNSSWRSYTTKDHTNYDAGGVLYFYKEVANYEDPVTECAPVTCGTPTTPTSSATTYGATIGWTDAVPGTMSKYQYAVWEKNGVEPTSGFSEVTTTSATVTGLLSNTEYRWKVRKVCTGTDGESAWLKSSFTTTGASLTFSVPEGVSAVAGQSSTSAMPNAGVPTNCGNCWAFAGWTTAAYEGTSAPAKLYPNGTIVHLSSSDGTTLYAVYCQTEFGVIWGTDELVNNGNYVLTYEIGDDIYALCNTDYSSYDAGVTTVTSLAREDADNYYLYNVSVNNIWKFTGSSTSGQLYNEVAEKYVNLSSTTAKLLNTTNNLTFTNDGAYWNIKSTNYLVSNSTTSYTVSASIGEDDYSAIIYRQTSSTYSTNPGCEEYSITWLQGGEEYEEGTPSTTATTCGGIETMPDDPEDDALACAEVFAGWSETELTGTGNGAPSDLFTTSNNAPRIDENKTFHAVFASLDDRETWVPTDKTMSITIANFTEITTSYTTTYKHTYSVDSIGNTGTVKMEAYGVFNNASGIQMNSDKGTYIKNLFAFPGPIKKIEMTWTASGKNSPTIYAAKGAVASSSSTSLGKMSSSSTSHSIDVDVSKGYNYFYFDGTTVTGACYMKELKITYVDTVPTLKDYVTYCTNEFTSAGNWSTTGNWSLSHVPTIGERAIIKKAAVVDVATAKAKEVIIYNDGSSNTGSLEISAGQALVVAETVRKTTNGSTESATGENDIVFGSTLAAGTGALVMNGYTSGNNKATVNFAVKAKKDNDGWVNQFIGTPFNDQGAVLYNYYGTQLYAFHPANDGSYDSGTSSAYDAWWSRLAESDGMDPFMGYNILCSKAESPILWMQGTLNASSNVTFSSLAGGAGVENLLANSWMAPIHIDKFISSDFSNVEQTIYIFNAGTPEQYKDPSKGAENADDPGTYIVLPINSAEWTSPTITVIPAMQGFSVYATDASPSLTLDYNRLVYEPALTSVGVVPTRAPRRARAAEDSDAPEVIHLRVAAESGYAAKAFILGRGDFSQGFDDGWDGRFMEGDGAAPQLYAPTENGNMVINCVPEIEGTVLCFKPGTADNVYTFSFGYEGEDSWYLNDLKEQQSTLINALDSYTFHSSADDMPARFVVSRTPIYKTPTGVEDADGRNQKSDVRKIVIDDHVFIIRNGLMYDVTGVLCK